MGRPPKSTAQHKLEGSYRADRHGARLDAQPQYPRIERQEPEPDPIYRPGIDAILLPRMLVSAFGLAMLFDVNEATVRRWAKTGVMPKPREIGGRRLWSADELRAWIDADCPDMSETPNQENR
jgi:predicted DNA-binding transcriptional regulator AlpA